MYGVSRGRRPSQGGVRRRPTKQAHVGGRRPARGRALLEWSVVGLTLFTPSTTREGFLGTETREKRWLVMA